MVDQAAPERLANLPVELSLATDLGTGQPMEHGLHTCWLALAAAQALGLDADARSCIYYVRCCGSSAARRMPPRCR